MSDVPGGPIFDPEDPDLFIADVFPVGSSDMVHHILDADPDSENGRSQYVWVRLTNGDLLLGVFPQGDLYFDVEVAVEEDYHRWQDSLKARQIIEEVTKRDDK